MRNEHSRTWSMARKLKIMEMEKTHMIGRELWRETLKNMKNEKYSLQELQYGKKVKIMENEKHTRQDVKHGEKLKKYDK